MPSVAMILFGIFLLLNGESQLAAGIFIGLGVGRSVTIYAVKSKIRGQI